MNVIPLFSNWLNDLLIPSRSNLPTKKLIIFCFLIFFVALPIKLLYWQDQASLTVNNLNALAYDTEAERILAGKGVLFPSQPPQSGDARLLVHPPGYSILVAISFTLFGNSLLPLSLIHQLFDSLSIIIFFLITLELFPLKLALMATSLAIFSPHFSYYSLNASPESPSNLFLLTASLFLVKTIKNFEIKWSILAGIFIGLSCWLRPNALMLSPFLAILFIPFLSPKFRLRYAITLVLTTAIVISPITIRNFWVFKQFIPISIGVGANLLEGIADYDLENKFGCPGDDQAVAMADVKLYNRADYAGNQWSPDGLMREKNRTKQAMEIIKSNPLWFAEVAIKRIFFMLSYNDKGTTRWPLNTAIVPILNAEASFGHSITAQGKSVWSTDPINLSNQGKTISQETKISLQTDKNYLVISGDSSNYGDQFSVSLIEITPNTDHILSLKIQQKGQSSIKITSSDQRNILATQIIAEKLTKNNDESTPIEHLIKIPFASGNRKEIKIILSNDSPNPVTNISEISLNEIGRTPYIWAKPFRLIIRGLQKNIYNTKVLLPILGLGTLLLLFAKQRQTLILILAIPVYFFCFQSILHTEYRYIYLIHYFLFLISATLGYTLFAGLYFLLQKYKKTNFANIK